MTVVACPTCTALIQIHIGKGGVVECPDCSELWVVTSEVPPKLVYALDIEEEGVFPDEEWRRPSG